MIKAFNESKLDKAIEQTAEYCKKYKVAKELAYLKLLRKIKSHANSRTSTNLLILKDKVSINNSENIRRLGINVEDIQVKSRHWIGGYVNKYCDGYTIKGIILKLKKMAPSYRATNG